jgi:metal-dependent HD superfamily phosphatase/phosphodiesterase
LGARRVRLPTINEEASELDNEKMIPARTGSGAAAAAAAIAEAPHAGNGATTGETDTHGSGTPATAPVVLSGRGGNGAAAPSEIGTAPATAAAGTAWAHPTLREIRREPRVRTYVTKANEQMAAIGYTEHGHRHAGIVATIARSILSSLGRDERVAELAAIAGYLHDIGCVVNRKGHVEAGAIIAFQILSSLNMDPVEIAEVVGAIGNHEEPDGLPINDAAAAVIIADKSDVHYTRVQNPDPADYDIHDKVNGAVRKSFLRVEPAEKRIRLELEIDTAAASVMEYFEIFITRMVLCRKAAARLGCTFHVSINGYDL